MRSLEEDLKAARDFHGHLCHGQVLGVRMARIGCVALGIDEPRVYKNLITYVETDRCAADAVCVVTGCTLGHRRLKWIDYGKMAATFVDLGTGRAVRVALRSAAPHGGRREDASTFWQSWRDEDIFDISDVTVEIPSEDMPGPPSRKAICARCGELVRDGREVRGMDVLCRACAGQPYYRIAAAKSEGVAP